MGVRVNNLKTSLCISTLSLMLAGMSIASPVQALDKPGTDRASDKLRMLRDTAGPMTIRGDATLPLADRVASQFAPRFGIKNPAAELQVKKLRTDNGRTHIRYQQLHQGIPVIGGELVANVNGQNQLMSMSGEVAAMRITDVTPGISAEQATQTAVAAMAKWYKFNRETFISSTPVLSIYDPTIIVTAKGSSQALAWQINVAPQFLSPINEFIVIDAKTGGILFHFNKIDTALTRRTYTANNTEVLPGTIVCQDPTACSTSDTDVLNAHNFAQDVYDFYFSTHGRDSIDGAGMPMVATVHFSTPTFGNAFWLGADPYLGATNQMIYGDGFTADDVVGHEMTHGVTENESNLFYYSESGAINESLSDVWGELIDLSNGAGTDTAGVRWKLGEDLPASVGIIRDMADPTSFGDPDRMTSIHFYVGPDDTGGVHTNSGVNNKAVYLMVDGDTFNTITVNGIGSVKTAKIYYHAQTTYLTSGSDYLDLYNALIASCNDLVGTDGIVAADCTEVQNALDAVEMNQSPSISYAPQATEICPVGVNIYDLFADDFEDNNTSPWVSANITGTLNPWSTGNINLASNSDSYTLMGDGSDTGTDNDSVLRTPTAIRVPQSTAMYIYFDHAYYFEQYDGISSNYDGGLIEYSIDNGTTWNDANGLIESGRNYTGALDTLNPQSGRQAYVGFSNGYVSTRLDLSPLNGQYVLFRFRNTADESIPSAPWFIDNFRMYLCADNAPPTINAGPDQIVNIAQSVQLNGTAQDPDNDIISTVWSQPGGDTVTLSSTTVLNPTFTAINTTNDLVFRLTVTDAFGNVETDDVTVSVGISLAGSGGHSGCSFNPHARFDPIWLTMLLFLAGLHVYRRGHKWSQ